MVQKISLFFLLRLVACSEQLVHLRGQLPFVKHVANGVETGKGLLGVHFAFSLYAVPEIELFLYLHGA